jgi:hypothetical protein
VIALGSRGAIGVNEQLFGADEQVLGRRQKRLRGGTALGAALNRRGPLS